MVRCKHGLTPETCGECSGLMDEIRKKQKVYKDRNIEKKEFNMKRDKLQEESKEFATRNNEDINKEELTYIIINTKGTTLQDIDILYQVAKHTKRRLGAIEWLWRLLWKEHKGQAINKKNQNVLKLSQSIKEEMGLLGE